MNLLGAIAVVAGFVVLLRILKVVPMALEVTARSRDALAVVRDPGLDDDAKAERMQAHARRLFALFFLVTIGAAAALLVPIGVVWLAARAGVMSFDGVLGVLLSWPFLAGTTLLAVVVVVLRRNA